MTLLDDSRFQPAPNVHARRFGDELVLLDLGRGEYFSLNALGALIWDGLVAGMTLGEAADRLGLRYEVEHARFRADVVAITDELLQRSLLICATDPK